MVNLTLFILALLSTLTFSTLIYIPGVPVSKLALLKAQVSLSRWENELNNNYGKRTENPPRTKANTDLLNYFLMELSKELAAYNNVVIGSQNQAAGTNNLIIGTNNTVLGSRNYIFTSDFSTISKSNAKPSGTLNHTIVSDNWVGELDRRAEIITNLHSVIYPVA